MNDKKQASVLDKCVNTKCEQRSNEYKRASENILKGIMISMWMLNASYHHPAKCETCLAGDETKSTF